jgi:hypothetical protein
MQAYTSVCIQTQALVCNITIVILVALIIMLSVKCACTLVYMHECMYVCRCLMYVNMQAC